MPTKDARFESVGSTGGARVGANDEMKKIERFLRLLTWQMFFLIAILLYLALRPQAGRYQFTVVGEDVGVFDTSNSQAWMIKLQKRSVTPNAQSGDAPAATKEEPPLGSGQP